jgi:hypothetical protein
MLLLRFVPKGSATAFGVLNANEKSEGGKTITPDPDALGRRYINGCDPPGMGPRGRAAGGVYLWVCVCRSKGQTCNPNRLFMGNEIT